MVDQTASSCAEQHGLMITSGANQVSLRFPVLREQTCLHALRASRLQHKAGPGAACLLAACFCQVAPSSMTSHPWQLCEVAEIWRFALAACRPQPEVGALC